MDYTVLCDMYRLSPDNLPASVIAYHVTPATNIDSILSNGLTAKACKATRYGDVRIEAVYLFAHRGDAYDPDVRAFLFGDVAVTVVKVEIPRSEFGKLREDGLFNMSCVCRDGSYPTGIQFRGSIPATWIVR